MARVCVKVNAIALGVLMRTLNEGMHTYGEIAEATGLHYTTAREWVNSLHAQKVVYIADWAADSRGRRIMPVWAFGVDVKDRPRPGRMPGHERQQRVRDRRAAVRTIQRMAGPVSA